MTESLSVFHFESTTGGKKSCGEFQPEKESVNRRTEKM
jgi:hypothetical protein